MPHVAREWSLPRDFVRSFVCPKCNAAAGDLCVAQDGADRKSNHAARVATAKLSRPTRSLNPSEPVTIVQLWTAGVGSEHKTGPGGWAVLLNPGVDEQEVAGVEDATTTNRMKLTSVIEGLRALTDYPSLLPPSR